jgi:DNA-binding YbaB/EbfC family protein
MKGGIGNLMRKAQQMQADMQKAQAELATLEVTGEAGGGAVKVVMNGKHELKRVSIDPGAAAGDRELLEDLVLVAGNDAVRKVEALVQQRFAGMLGGMQLPPGFKMPF